MVENIVNELCLSIFEDSVVQAIASPISGIGGAGFSCKSLLLSGTQVGAHRSSVVSVNRWCDMVELLITDADGKFLTYQKYSIVLGVSFIASKFYAAWCDLKPLIGGSIGISKSSCGLASDCIVLGMSVKEILNN